MQKKEMMVSWKEKNFFRIERMFVELTWVSEHAGETRNTWEAGYATFASVTFQSSLLIKQKEFHLFQIRNEKLRIVFAIEMKMNCRPREL